MSTATSSSAITTSRSTPTTARSCTTRAAEPVIKRRDAKPQPPRAPLDFFDRAGELAQVEQLITQGKPVAICGSDGAGKSALLRQAANGTAAHTLPDGVILLEGLDEQGHTLLPRRCDPALVRRLLPQRAAVESDFGQRAALPEPAAPAGAARSPRRSTPINSARCSICFPTAPP